MRQALEQARLNQTIVRIGVNGEQHEGKVVSLDNDTFAFQPWRSPAEARSLTTMAGIHIGPQPIRLPRWLGGKPEPEPTVFETVALNTPPLTIAVDAVTYVKELV